MINDRVHGSPISGIVKKKLEDRQRVAGEVAPGESIEAVFPNKDGNNQADLSSRTPFVRMWTSVKLIDPELITEKLEKIILSENVTDQEEFKRNFESRIGKLREEFPEAKLTKINGEYYIKNIGNDVREQVDYARKTYIIGDYNYQTAYGSVDTNASLEGETETTTQAGDVSDIFPQELKNNTLLHPQAGITGLTSETEGAFGEKKKTTVNFVVHNFEDYDKIYSKFFLKPSATIFVDFGWSSIKNLYNPTDLIDSSDIKKFLYDSNVVAGYEDKEEEETLAEGESVEESVQNIGEVSKNQGDLEVIQGLVVDYNSKILPNGSVDCQLTLMSTNSALLDLTVDDSIRRHIQDTLSRATLYLGLQATLNNVTTYDEWNADGSVTQGDFSDTSQYRNSTPNADISAKDLETFNKNLELEAYKVLSSGNLTPTGDSIRGGVYVNSAEADDVYVCWGFIEDIIINQNFGFGKNSDDINNGNNFRVRMDSSNQFTTWNEIFVERQQTLSKVPEEPPVFLFPEWWGGSDTGQDDSFAEETVVNGSYNYFNKKYPKNFYEDNDPFNHRTYDEHKNRIPIREIFINIETVISAFKRNKTVKKSLEDILKTINKDSNYVFDWRIVSGAVDSELIIIDNNRTDTGQKILDSGISSDTSEDADEFTNLFTFNIMSPNSIIKDYNLEFKIPPGDLGNMLSIQGMSHENKILPLSSNIDDMAAINSIDDDSLSIVYEPDLGSYRSSQNDSKENKDSDYYNVYQSANYLIDNNIYKTGIVRRSTDILKAAGLKSSNLNPQLPNEKKDNPADKTSKDIAEEIIQQYTQELIDTGNKVVSSFKDYYRIREIKNISLNTKFNLLPYTLSLTTYGIGSIVPGDTFRVDYLPKDHLKNTFLQTIKVAHNINSDGWYTTLDTMYRPLAKNKKKYYLDQDLDKIYLSPTVLKNLNLDNGFYSATDKGTFKFIQHIIPYMYKLQIVKERTKHIDFMISFKTIRGLSDRMQDMRSGNTVYQIAQKKTGLRNKIDSYHLPSLNLISFVEGEEVDYIWPMNEVLRPDQEYILIVQGRSSFITAKETFYSEDGVNMILFYFDRPIDTSKPIPKGTATKAGAAVINLILGDQGPSST